MRWRLVLEGARIALDSIRAHKLRSFLTLLANVIAVGSVIAVVSLLSGMDAYVKEKIADEGSGVLTVSRVDELLALSSFEAFLESQRNPPITADDVEALRDAVPSAVAVAAEASRQTPLEAGPLEVDDARVRGVTESYAEVRELPLRAGRHLAPFEVRRAAPVAVIGADVADALFPERDALEERVRIRGRSFRVVGVAEPRGSLLGQSRDLFALVPLGAYRKLFGYRQSLEIDVKARDLAALDETRDEVVAAMRLRHRLRPGARNDFAVTSAANLVSLWERISRSIFVALTVITAISLVIGGIIIMNVMLVSVTGRTREIGVRMALGARRSSILWQFLVEAVTFSAAGGLVGVAGGFLAAALVAAASPLPYRVEPWAVAAGIAVTAVTGLVFGIGPASRAARLDPIEALRWE